MATIAELLIKLGMDDGGLDKGMSSSQSKLKSWGDNLKGIGTKLTAGVTLPLVAAGAAAINWASDQEEAGNKVDQVFKGNAKVSFTVTFSAGITSRWGKMRIPPEVLVDEADKAMYVAKASGRNAIKLSSAPQDGIRAQQSMVRADEKKFLFGLV